MEQKQTAVEWLFEKINMFCMFTDGIPDEWSEALEQAKEMEKQQKREFFEQGYKSGITDYIDIQNGYDGRAIGFKKYYNEEYGNET